MIQALAISVAPAAANLAAANHASAQSDLEKAANANGSATFAKQVRDILERTSSDAGKKPVSPAKADSSSTTKVKPAPLSPCAGVPAPQIVASTNILPSPASNLPVLPLLPVQLSLGSAVGEPSASSPSAPAQDPAQTEPVAISPDPPPDASNPSVPTGSQLLSAVVPAPAVPGLPSFSAITQENSISNTPLPTDLQLAPTLATPTGTTPIGIAPTGTPAASAAPTKSTAPILQVFANAPLPDRGEPLSSILEHLSLLQHTSPVEAPTAPALLVSLENKPSASGLLQPATKAALPLPLTPSTTATPVASSWRPIESSGPPRHETHDAPVSAGGSSSEAEASSRDSSSDAGGESFSDGSPSAHPQPVLPTGNESAAFSQVLAVPSASNAVEAQGAGTTGAAAPSQAIPVNARQEASSSDVAQSGAALPSAPSTGTHETEAAVNRFVTSSQLLDSAAHSEMRVSMETDKLGVVELRARVAGDAVGAAIMVEKRDAHAALAIELPALQQALSDKQLRVDQVSLLHGSFSSSTGDSGAPAQQGQRGLHSAPHGSWTSPGAGNFFSSASPEQAGIFDSQGRLSVRV